MGAPGALSLAMPYLPYGIQNFAANVITVGAYFHINLMQANIHRFYSAFAKQWRKTTFASSCLPVNADTQNRATPARRIFVKIHVHDFY